MPEYEPPSVTETEGSSFESVMSILASMGDISVARENNEYRINLVTPTGAMISRRGANLYQELLLLSQVVLPVVMQPVHNTVDSDGGVPRGEPMGVASGGAYLRGLPASQLANMLQMAVSHEDRRFYTPTGSIHADAIREEILNRTQNQASEATPVPTQSQATDYRENEFITWFEDVRPVPTQSHALNDLEDTVNRYLRSLSRPARMDAFHSELKILVGELKRTLRRNDDAAIYQYGFAGSSNPEMYETTEDYKRQTLNLTLAFKRMVNFLQMDVNLLQADDLHSFLARLLKSMGAPIFRCASLSTAKVVISAAQALPYRTRLGLAYMLYRRLRVHAASGTIAFDRMETNDWKDYYIRQQPRHRDPRIVRHLQGLGDTELRNYHSMAANDRNRNVMTTGFGAISYDLIEEEINHRYAPSYERYEAEEEPHTSVNGGREIVSELREQENMPQMAEEEPYTGQTNQPVQPDEAQAEAEAISAVGLHEIAEVEREHESITYADLVRDRPIADIAFYIARAQDLQRRLSGHPPDRLVPQEVEIREHLILYCKRLVWMLNDEASAQGQISATPVSRKINGLINSLRVLRDTLQIALFRPQSVASNWERPYLHTVEEIGEKLSHIIAPEDAFHITTALKVLRAISKQHIMRKLAVEPPAQPTQAQGQEQRQSDVRTHELNVYNSYMSRPSRDNRTTGQRIANMDDVIRELRVRAGSGRLAQPIYLKINFLVEKLKDLIRSNHDVDVIRLARLMNAVIGTIGYAPMDASVTGWPAYLNVVADWLGTTLAGGRNSFAGIGGENAGMLVSEIMLLEERKKVGLVSILSRLMGSRNVLFTGSDLGASGSWRRLADATPTSQSDAIPEMREVTATEPPLDAYATQQRMRITQLLESDMSNNAQRMERLRTAEASLTQQINNAVQSTPDVMVELLGKLRHICINLREAVTEDRVLRRTGQDTPFTSAVTAAGPFTMELACKVKDLINRMEIRLLPDDAPRTWEDCFRDYMNKLAYDLSPIIGADDTFNIVSGFNSLSQAACQVIMHVVEDNVSHPAVVAQEAQERRVDFDSGSDRGVIAQIIQGRTPARSNDPVPENEEI